MLQTLEVLIEVGNVYVTDIEKLVMLLRFCDRNHSGNNNKRKRTVSSSSSSSGQLSAVSVSLIKKLCELLMKHAGIMTREDGGGPRSSAFIFCVETLVSEGHVEDAWQLLVSHASAAWFITNHDLHVLYGSVAVVRAVALAHDWFRAIPSNQKWGEFSLRCFKRSGRAVYRDWSLPSMSDVSMQPELFVNIVRFLRSKRACRLAKQPLRISAAVIKELQTALERAVKKDTAAQFFDLHQYYCAVLVGTKSVRLVRDCKC